MLPSGQEPLPGRRSSMTLFVGMVALVVIAVGGYFAWKALSNQSAPETPPAETTPTPEPTTDTYASSTLGISITYLRGYTVNDAFVNTSVNPNKPIRGVKFTISTEMAIGTNLSADTGLSIEWLPRAKNCTGDIYLAANVKPVKMTDNGILYSVASSTGAAAGNMYEEFVYAIASSSPCTAVRYFIHSGTIGNYPPGAVREFDKAALLHDFDSIRNSLTLR